MYACSDYIEMATDIRSLLLATGSFRPVSRPTCVVEVSGSEAGRDEQQPELTQGECLMAPPAGIASVVSWGGLSFERRRFAWLDKRPYVLGTERDQVCEMKWRTSYKMLLTRI